MGLQRIENVATTDFSNQGTEATIDPKFLNSPNYVSETELTYDFESWYGIYESVPEAKIIVDTLVKWGFGKGYKADEKTKEKLLKIVGNGKENFLRVWKNLQKTKFICGACFGHIIQDNSGRLVNLKPLNPTSMKVIFNEEGIITKFKQKIGDFEKEYDVKEILYLTCGRVGDEMGGHSIFEVLKDLIESRKELMSDLRTLFHRFVVPIKIWEADTDNQNKLDDLTTKINQAWKKYENLVTPRGTLGLKETLAVPTQTGGLSPLEYYGELIRIFISSCGVPEVILGWGKDTTEASGKVVYLAWQQTIEDIQREAEDDLMSQLKIEINFEFPQSIIQDLKTDERKDGKVNNEKKSETDPSMKTEVKK